MGAGVYKVHSYKPRSTSLSLTRALQGNEPHPACGQTVSSTNHSSEPQLEGKAGGFNWPVHLAAVQFALFTRLRVVERRKRILNRLNKNNTCKNNEKRKTKNITKEISFKEKWEIFFLM